jgi:adenosylhomocysteine nucleosidase
MREFKRTGKGTFVMRDVAVEVHAVITGIGARKFQLPAGDICLVSGVAGSLKEEHHIGNILVAKRVKSEGIETVVSSENSLVTAATRCGAVGVDFFYTANTVVGSSSEKARLGRMADAVDMESYSIMAEAQRRGMPAVAVRAVSDTADQSLPLDFNRAIDENGNIDWLPALLQVATSPLRLPHLMRFGWDSSRAARKLAHFLDKYLICLTAEAGLSFVRSEMVIG